VSGSRCFPVHVSPGSPLNSHTAVHYSWPDAPRAGLCSRSGCRRSHWLNILRLTLAKHARNSFRVIKTTFCINKHRLWDLSCREGLALTLGSRTFLSSMGFCYCNWFSLTRPDHSQPPCEETGWGQRAHLTFQVLAKRQGPKGGELEAQLIAKPFYPDLQVRDLENESCHRILQSLTSTNH
jgi:hypothetical protein